MFLNNLPERIFIAGLTTTDDFGFGAVFECHLRSSPSPDYDIDR
ncbi:MAG: hypothetical protein OXL36_10390 [Bryobacterales bacterium]|nr:hypothetical protein [Bryobacterales bacterium]